MVRALYYQLPIKTFNLKINNKILEGDTAVTRITRSKK